MTAESTQTIPQGPQVLDEAALIRLLALAGPTDAFELMRRLRVDLHDVAVGLTAGLASHDTVAIRRHSHVLLAIAGTIGAQHIYLMAQTLNQSAREASNLVSKADAADLMRMLNTLIERLPVLAVEQGLGG